jgi:hypothetical protein
LEGKCQSGSEVFFTSSSLFSQIVVVSIKLEDVDNLKSNPLQQFQSSYGDFRFCSPNFIVTLSTPLTKKIDGALTPALDLLDLSFNLSLTKLLTAWKDDSAIDTPEPFFLASAYILQESDVQAQVKTSALTVISSDGMKSMAFGWEEYDELMFELSYTGDNISSTADVSRNSPHINYSDGVLVRCAVICWTHAI